MFLIALQTGGGIAETISAFAPMALIFLVFYWFFIRPQSKKQKEQTSFVDDIKSGDQVVTSSGIIGKVSKIEGHTVSLQVDQKTFIKIYKSAISKEMTDGLKAPAENN